MSTVKGQRMGGSRHTGDFQEPKQLDKTSAYLIACYLSDGCIYHHKTDWASFKMEVIDEDFAQKCQACINKLLDRNDDIRIAKSRTNPEKPTFIAYTGNQEMCRWLEDITGKKSYFPQEIYTAPKEIQMELISGLYDGEGWVGKIEHWNIGIASTSVWVLELKDLLKQLGVNSANIFRRQNGGIKPLWAVNTSIREMKKAGFYFNIQRKQKRWEEYQVRSSETKK